MSISNSYDALWSRLTASLSGVQTLSRRTVVPDAVPPEMQPAVTMEQTTVETQWAGNAPGEHTVRATIGIYAWTMDDAGPLPVLTALIDQIYEALRWRPGEGPRQPSTTLGGAVARARPVGVQFGGGARDDGVQGTAAIDIEMVLTG